VRGLAVPRAKIDLVRVHHRHQFGELLGKGLRSAHDCEPFRVPLTATLKSPRSVAQRAVFFAMVFFIRPDQKPFD
jgi:hypothetical protein